MDLRQLRYFVTIAHAGSVTAAARQLRVAQPALSQHMLALERELGSPLLERGARGVRLTESGKILLQHALVVLQDLERARHAVKQSEVASGEVAIGLPTTVAGFLGPPLLREFFVHLPNVTIRLVESHSGFLYEWLEVGRLDIAILFNITNANGVEIIPIFVEEMYLLSSPDSSQTGPEIPFADLSDLDLIMSSHPHGLRRQLDETAVLVSGRPAKIRAEVNALSTIKRVVSQGLGHTILPLAAALDELNAGALIARRIVQPVIERHAALVVPTTRPKIRAQLEVMRVIRDVCCQLIEAGQWRGLVNADGLNSMSPSAEFATRTDGH